MLHFLELADYPLQSLAAYLLALAEILGAAIRRTADGLVYCHRDSQYMDTRAYRPIHGYHGLCVRLCVDKATY